MNILFSWLGTRDIINMKDDRSAALSKIALTSDVQYQRVIVLSDHDRQDTEQYRQWLNKKIAIATGTIDAVETHVPALRSPIHYPSITKTTQKWIELLCVDDNQVTFNLTSGTPAMSTVSMLLGKANTQCRFMQSSPTGEVHDVNIDVDFAKVYTSTAQVGAAQSAAEKPRLGNGFSNIAAKSQRMKQVITQAKRVACTELPVLIQGETGTGKELMARAIHEHSNRSDKPFIPVNCGALPDNLVESILFGHVKGAFTGADRDHQGVFEQAEGGTLFLDEMGDLKPDVQVKLLRALQEKQITAVGGSKSKFADVRIISATHRDLMGMVAEGQFREDLFYRIAIGIIHMPALRERQADIPQIVSEFSTEINHKSSTIPGYISKKISAKGIEFTQSQPWLGNVRELWSTLNRASLWAEVDVIDEHHINNALLKRPNVGQKSQLDLSYGEQVDINQIIDKEKKKYLEQALSLTGYSKTKTAKMLGLKSHQVVGNWMRELGLSVE